MSFLLVVSYTRDERRRYPSSYSLPTFMTLVGCYGTEERLTNCSYHEFVYSTSSYGITSSTSMDVSISCDTLKVETSASMASNEAIARASSEAMASLSISVILVVVVVILVAVLIIVLIMQRKKKTANLR